MQLSKLFILIILTSFVFNQKNNFDLYSFLKENPHSIEDNDFSVQLFFQDLNNSAISDYAKFIGDMYFIQKDYHDAFSYYFMHLALKPQKTINDTIFSRLYSIMTVFEESDFKNNKSKWEQFISNYKKIKNEEMFYEIIKLFIETSIEEHYTFLLKLSKAYIIQFPQSKFRDTVSLIIAEIYKRESKEKNALFYYRFVQKITPQSSEYVLAMMREAELLREEFKEYMKAKLIYDRIIEQFPKHSLHESALFEQAEMLYRKMDMQHLALEKYHLYIKLYPKSKNTEKVYPRLISIYRSNKQYSELSNLYREAIKNFPETELALQYQNDLIELYSKDMKQRDFAANEMIRFAELFPNHKYAADQLYDAAIIYADELTNLKKSKEILELMIKNFPNSDSLNKAKKFLNEINDKLQRMQEILNKNQ